jgi:hypothetical protein
MKLKLFNGTLTRLSLNIVAGGYDPEQGCVTVMVRGDDDQAGTLQCSIAEANKLVSILSANVPKVEKVEVK